MKPEIDYTLGKNPKFLRYLLGLLLREVNTCGLDTKPGQEAKVAAEIIRSQIESLGPARPARPKARRRDRPNARPGQTNGL